MLFAHNIKYKSPCEYQIRFIRPHKRTQNRLLDTSRGKRRCHRNNNDLYAQQHSGNSNDFTRHSCTAPRKHHPRIHDFVPFKPPQSSTKEATISSNHIITKNLSRQRTQRRPQEFILKVSGERNETQARSPLRDPSSLTNCDKLHRQGTPLRKRRHAARCSRHNSLPRQSKRPHDTRDTPCPPRSARAATPAPTDPPSSAPSPTWRPAPSPPMFDCPPEG